MSFVNGGRSMYLTQKDYQFLAQKEPGLLEEIQVENRFWSNVEYNINLSHRKAKPKHRGIIRVMKAEAVLKELGELGIITSERTLQRYVKDGLVPMPERRNAGRGRGRMVDYATQTTVEFAASIALRKGKNKYPARDVYIAREIALSKEGDIRRIGVRKNIGYAVDGKIVDFAINKDFYNLIIDEGKIGDIIFNPDGNINFVSTKISPINLHAVIASMWIQNKLIALAGFNPQDERVAVTTIQREDDKSLFRASVYKRLTTQQQ
jgi:hypothetical protein